MSSDNNKQNEGNAEAQGDSLSKFKQETLILPQDLIDFMNSNINRAVVNQKILKDFDELLADIKQNPISLQNLLSEFRKNNYINRLNIERFGNLFARFFMLFGISKALLSNDVNTSTIEYAKNVSKQILYTITHDTTKPLSYIFKKSLDVAEDTFENVSGHLGVISNIMHYGRADIYIWDGGFECIDYRGNFPNTKNYFGDDEKHDSIIFYLAIIIISYLIVANYKISDSLEIFISRLKMDLLPSCANFEQNKLIKEQATEIENFKNKQLEDIKQIKEEIDKTHQDIKKIRDETFINVFTENYQKETDSNRKFYWVFRALLLISFIVFFVLEIYYFTTDKINQIGELRYYTLHLPLIALILYLFRLEKHHVNQYKKYSDKYYKLIALIPFVKKVNDGSVSAEARQQSFEIGKTFFNDETGSNKYNNMDLADMKNLLEIIAKVSKDKS